MTIHMTQLTKIITIVLKLAEFVTLLIGTAAVSHYMNVSLNNEGATNSYNLGQYGRLEFFIFTTSMRMIISIVSFLLYITGMLDKINLTQVMITIHAIWTWLLLISSALLAKTVNTLDSENGGNISYCDFYDKTNADYQCGQLVTGVVFGFFAMIFFAADAGVYIFTFMTGQGPQSEQSTGNGGGLSSVGMHIETRMNPAVVNT